MQRRGVALGGAVDAEHVPQQHRVHGATPVGRRGSGRENTTRVSTPMPALLVNYVLGFTVVLTYALVAREPWPALGRVAGAPWWAWAGGAAGAAYGITAILLAHSLGAATLMALAVSGQLLAAVLFDHFGWLGFAVHPAGWVRLGGCVLMVAGFVMIAKW